MTDRYARIREALEKGAFDFGEECCGRGEWNGNPSEPPECCGRPLTYADTIRELLAERDELAKDAARYRWLRDTLTNSVGGGVEVNDDALAYQQSEPGEEVRVYWYPDTPVGFYEVHGSTIDAAIDVAMSKEGRGDE